VDTSSRRLYGGAGLGLVISKRLAEMLGGEIGIQSQKGKGSTFWFTVALETSRQPTAGRAKTAPDLRDLSILVVDDSAASRQAVCEQLNSWGFSPDMAEDGPAALGALRRRTADGTPFDIVILDLQMPGMGGLELSRRIQTDPEISKNVRVIMTTVNDLLDQEAMAAAGISHCLIKPIRQSRLFDAIAEAMARSAGAPQSPPKTAAAPGLAAIAKSRDAMILLAEDNEINQIMASEILKVAGYRYEVVCNGQEAVAALLKKPFDLVLMDCQMPEVDGLEATRRIRRKESEGAVLSTRGGRLPIIALTANALSGKRERCLEAGMDGYLSKPIIPEDMVRTIESFLSPEAARDRSGPDADAEPAAAPVSSADGRPPFDLDELLKRCMGNRDFMAKILDKFAHSVGADMERLEQAVSHGDLKTAAAAAHMMKGMGANLSAEGLRQAAMELERTCHDGLHKDAASALARLRDEVHRCLAHVPDALAELPIR
jgi:CheY-like chemotaxis protein/HPt (histidine-containing phosphotransfer) domain-containing protein